MSDRPEMTHELKSDQDPFREILEGRKRFEIRRDDHGGFAVGDVLVLRETAHPAVEVAMGQFLLEYTGRTYHALVTYVLRGPHHGLEEGWVILGFVDAPAEGAPEIVRQLVHDLGGKIETVSGPLPDGSGFATASFPLPADHWLTAPGDNNRPPMPFRMGREDSRRKEWAERILAATRYAARCCTMNGKEMDFDPDALVQNMQVALLGYWTDDGLSTEEWANPDPVPPIYRSPRDASLDEALNTGDGSYRP